MNIINFFTFFVIVIGSAALFVVLSAFAGLKTFSLQFTNTFDPDLKVKPVTGKFFSLAPEQDKALAMLTDIAAYSKEIEERVYLSFKEKNGIAYIKGIDPSYTNVTGIDSTMYIGNWELHTNKAVIGIGIFNLLGGPLGPRAPLTAITLKPGERSITADALASNSFYNRMPLEVGGVYAIEEDLDKKYVFAPLPMVQAFLEKNTNQFSGINLRLKDGVPTETIKKQLKEILGDNFLVLSRQELNGSLHKMLKTENTATYLIFTLVLVIALFNLVGAIIILILDKREDSKTLFALGATIPELQRIYFLQGVLVSILGGLFGIVLGSLFIGSQLWLKWWMITPSLPYPVEYQFINNVIVLGTIVVLGLISSKIASSRISKKLLS